MFVDLQTYPWVLPLHSYTDAEDAASRVFPLLLASATRT